MASAMRSENEQEIGELAAVELRDMTADIPMTITRNANLLPEAIFKHHTGQRQAAENDNRPIVFMREVSSIEECNDPELLTQCLNADISLISGMTEVCGVDLNAFSTESLILVDPLMEVETREQRPTTGQRDRQTRKRETSWKCISEPGTTDIASYAQLQQKALQDEAEGRRVPANKKVRFATNIDLLDEDLWNRQINEIKKLPGNFTLGSPDDMLTFAGHQIEGMNSLQLYCKTPDCITPAHNENLDSCSVNLNCGPGDCYWKGISREHVGTLRGKFRNELHYSTTSWIPVKEDLEEAGVPVFTFTQKPGQLVFVSYKTVHWVRCINVCNNAAWNLLPGNPVQYSFAIERYMYNINVKYCSIVPMVLLTWNCARDMDIKDDELRRLMRTVMARCLLRNFKILEIVRERENEIRFEGRNNEDGAHYCSKCKTELFDIRFVYKGRVTKYCFECVQGKGNFAKYICTREYSDEELEYVYNNF